MSMLTLFTQSKFIDYAPRTVSTLPPKKSRDRGGSSATTGAAGGNGASASPGSLPSGSSPALARPSGAPLSVAGAQRTPSSIANSATPSSAAAAALAAANNLVSPPGRRYATPTAPPVRRPPIPLNAGVLPASNAVTPGTSDVYVLPCSALYSLSVCSRCCFHGVP